jgi:ADP-ribose pyrophosphatase YjhB (NUDIX family)
MLGVKLEYKLNNPKRKKIFEQFLYNKKLRFNEIEKLSGIRSNELAYFLQKLVDEGTVVKDDDVYRLSEQAVKYIPFFIDSPEKISPLPCNLVACVEGGRILLWKRGKFPYKDMWGLPGGRIRLHERVEETSKRLLKDIAFVDAEVVGVNALVNEKHVIDDELKHGFLIVFTLAKPLNSIKDKDDVKWFDLGSLPDNMIPSDQWLVENRLESRIELHEERILEKDGKVEIDFRQ